MAHLVALVAGLLMLAGAQASDIADRSMHQGFLSKYLQIGADASKTSLGDYDKLITHRSNHLRHGGAHDAIADFNGHGGNEASTISDELVRPAVPVQGSMDFASAREEPFINTREINPSKIMDREQEKAVQKLFAKNNGSEEGMSVAGVALLTLAMMLGVRWRRRLQQSIDLASSDGHVSGMSIPMAPASHDNALELKVHEPSIRDQEEVMQKSGIATAGDNFSIAGKAVDVGRRTALASLALGLAAPALAEDFAISEPRLNWLEPDKTPKAAAAKQIIDFYYGLEFVTYLSRFLLNFDSDCVAWWAEQVATVPKSYDAPKKRAFLAAKFGTFTSSVEYGLRRYPGVSGRKALFEKLVSQHGFDPERRRHLALAFTLLRPERQPVAGIRELLVGVPVYGTSNKGYGGGVGALIPPAFTPGLADYFYYDPLALLPKTQFPVLDETGKAYEIRGLAPILAESREVFGRRGERFATRERPLDFGTYAFFAVAGLIGCSGTHAVLVPIDVVKTRQQTDTSSNQNLGAAAISIYENEGLSGLFLGAAPTLAGYCYYGLTVYPGFEYFSRTLSTLVAPSEALEFRAAIVLLSGALATLVACVGVCPAEAIRIRVVSDPRRFAGDNLVNMAQRVALEEGGYGVLYNGFRPLAVRQVIFGMVKFFFFDSLADAIFEIAPSLEATASSRLLVSCLAGLAAGTASSLVSQPADAVLSRVNAKGGDYPVLQAARDILDEESFGGFYRGALARCAWSGLVISGQFTVYDILKSAFEVAGPDLTLHLDIAL